MKKFMKRENGNRLKNEEAKKGSEETHAQTRVQTEFSFHLIPKYKILFSSIECQIKVGSYLCRDSEP